MSATSPHHNIRPAIAGPAGLLAIAACAGMFFLDQRLKVKGAWALYLVAAPIHILLQIFAEGIFEAFWLSRSWIVKAFPIVVIAAYYALWCAVKL